MRTYKVDFIAAANADLREGFSLTEGGAALDLSAATWRMQIVDAAGAVKLTLTLGAGVTIDVGTPGYVLVTVLASQWAGIAPGTYKHDLLLMRGTKTDRVFYGTLDLRDGVTHVV
jgi:hypothetical protein